MDVKPALEHFGLDAKQAEIYLAALQLGKSTAADVAERAGIKRSTTYVKLDELNIKGLIDISKSKSSTLYRAVSPKRLVELANYRKNQMEEILPDLMTLYKDDPDKPKIQTFEGFNAVEQVYEEFFKTIKRGDEILVFGTIAHVDTPAFNAAMHKWLRTLKQRQVRTREIVDVGEMEVGYIKHSVKAKNPYQQMRVIDSKGLFASDNFIYEDKMVMFAVRKHIYVTSIEDKDIVGTYRKLFEMAWEQAKPIA